MSRAGQALLWLGGLGVALLLGYSLVLDIGLGGSRLPNGRRDTAATVVVFYPESVLWQELRQGVRVCERKGLARVDEWQERSVEIHAARSGRRVRFVLDDVRGVLETRDAARRAVQSLPSLIAVVGSSNTLLTAALADAVRVAGGATGPVLLVPWASAMQTERPEPASAPIALLDIHAGRTFRFCLNNQYQADLVVSCLAEHEGARTPRRAVLVEDRFDPYSVDLTTSFHKAVQRAVPATEITERANALSVPLPRDPLGVPGPAEDALAESICHDAEQLPDGQTTWVFLPLQEDPARRMVQALRRHSRHLPGSGEGPLRVVCGDAVGAPILAELAGHCPFPVWAVSSMATRPLDTGLSADVWVQAEMVAAVIRYLEQPGAGTPSPEGLRETLATLRIEPGGAGSPGRSLAFSRSGERVGGDLGHVLMIRPDRKTVYAVTRGPDGRWRAPEALAEGVGGVATVP